MNLPNPMDYDPHERVVTIIYDSDGVEIDRKEGAVAVSGREYDAYLPVEVVQVKVTQQVLNTLHIYPKGGDNA